MTTYQIEISSAEQLKSLVKIVQKYDECDVDLWNDFGCVDCKSPLGVLQMGTGKNLRLNINGSKEKEEALKEELSEIFPVFCRKEEY